jgi:hypothetical protein
VNLASDQPFYVTGGAHLNQQPRNGRVSGIFSIAPPNWAVVLPKYYILDLLYAPPGNSSSAGFSNGSTESTTTTIGDNFMSGTSQSYTFSLGFGGNKASVGTTSGSSTTTSNSSAFQESFQSTSGSTLKSTENVIDHTQDQFWLLLNPQVTIVQTGQTGVQYSISTINNEYADVVNVSVKELITPSLIPLSVLETQTDPTTGNPLPGLKNVCANPLPDNECTTANACGCVARDFSAIIPVDELNTNPNLNPVTYDSSRFDYLTTITLEGPACSTCDPVTNTYSITDSDISSKTSGSSQSYSVGYSTGYSESFLGIVSYSETDSQNFQWSNSVSFGSSNGTSHTETVTLGTTAAGCYQAYDVYEDGIFHTFTFYPVAPGAPSC